jgi:hypothetical protein
LAKDIYLVYEQLRLIGAPAQGIFKDFTPDTFGSTYTPLHDVLKFEWLELKDSFITFGQYYCSQIQQCGYGCTEDVFDNLIQVPGFDAWIRAFHDLHGSINKSDETSLHFKQSRIVDSLIVMSVRTEIVLREMFREELGDQADVDSNKKLLTLLKIHMQEKSQKILETCSNEVSEKTRLKDRPPEIFEKIDCIKPNNWPQKDIYFLRSILKFMTARNYFAHHAYKDDYLNIQTSNLSRQVIESLLATLLFFQKYKISSGDSC